MNVPASSHHKNAASFKSVIDNVILLKTNKIGSEKITVMLSVKTNQVFFSSKRWNMGILALENLKYLYVPSYLSLCVREEIITQVKHE